jgi:hypothetical protein
MNNKLPWEVYFYGTIEKRTIRDAEKHTVNVYDTACAEFIVTACNAYEANQAEITQLKAKLELCREAIEACSHYMPDVGHFCACGTCKDCGKQIPYVGYEYCVECVGEKILTALAAIEVRDVK